MRFLFIVQGEGRGHMTQAMSLAELLRKNGHEVTRVIVGRSYRRQIPDFFKEGIQARMDHVDSPNFVTDRENKSVRLFRSIWHAILRLGTYHRSVRQMHEMVKEDQPDLIVNFFDFIGGLYNFLKRPDARFVCVAHQYLSGHSSFEFPEGNWFDKKAMKLGNWLTALKADQRLALAFRELPDEPGIEVVPPLLRKEVTERSVSDQGHFLIYMLNDGYSEAIDQFHSLHPEVILHCFWDKKDAPQLMKVDDSLTYHQLDGDLFLDLMASCRGFLTTAGFESVCEAMYYGKPVMMMPVDGHYEQKCNALDAELVGAGIQSDTFDLRRLLDYLPNHKTDPAIFRNWVQRSEAILLQKLTED